MAVVKVDSAARSGGAAEQVIGVGGLDFYSNDIPHMKGPVASHMDAAVDLGRIAFAASERSARLGLIDQDRDMLADLVFPLPRADRLLPLHEAAIAGLLNLRRHE